MVSVFVEAGDLFSCESATQREDEIVVRKFSFNLAVRDDHLSFERIDVSNFRLDEVHSSIQHLAPQIE